MLTTEEKQEKLARLARLRQLGIRRGFASLPTSDHNDVGPVSPPLSPGREKSASGAVEVLPAGEALSSLQVADTVAMASPGLPGEAVETPFGSAWVRTVRYRLADRPDLAGLLEIEPAALAAAGRDPDLLRLDPGQAAFVDTETTGLTPDTTTYTFLISIGMYENVRPAAGQTGPSREGEFVVRQFFMRSPAEERSQLHLVEEALGRVAGIISFNGRGFDLPLLHNRFILACRPAPWLGLPHLDLLPAARRIWRGRLESCRLNSLERHILAVHRTAEDVPGFLIPEIYRQYYLSGIVSDLLVRVFYHNLVDITSLPLLAAHLGRLYQAHDLADRLAALGAGACLGLARACIDLGWHEGGIQAYRAVLARSASDDERRQAYRDLAYLLKRLGRRAEAAALWEEWIAAMPGDDLTPYVELAKYHEWHTGELALARGWAAWALRLAERRETLVEGNTMALAGSVGETTVGELRHRLARLEQKLAARAASKAGAHGSGISARPISPPSAAR